MKKLMFVCCLAGIWACVGCVSMSGADRAAYREIRALGLDTSAGDIKSPVLAAGLNILPGIGNFYLAAGSDEGSQWVYGILNFLAWPLSIFWGVPEAGIDASTINKRETVYYYQLNPIGKQQYEAAKARWSK